MEETVQTASGETVMECVSKYGMQRVECLWLVGIDFAASLGEHQLYLFPWAVKRTTIS